MKGTASYRGIKDSANERKLTLFISYSHQNKAWMKRLQVLLDGQRYDDRAHNLVGLAEVSLW